MIPYYQKNNVSLYLGDALQVLKELPDESVDMVMTSPPYYALRDYQVDGQIGLEESPEMYLEKLWSLFDEIKRVLKKMGTIFVNMGDTYSSAPAGNKGHIENEMFEGKGDNYRDSIALAKRKIFDKNKYGGKNGIHCGRGRLSDVPPKCMMMLPERFAFGMIERDWILRNKICWYKPNSMPSSVKDRFSCSWEYVYFFSKSRKYYFDLDAVRVPPISELNYKRPRMGQGNQTIYEQKRAGGFVRARNYRNKTADQSYKISGQIDPKYKNREYTGRWGNDGKGMAMPEKYNNLNGKNPGDHWVITTKPFKEAHFATYPPDLCEIPIKAGCPPGGVVLDPFNGSGTTGIVALKLGRKYIGIELNEKYLKDITIPRLEREYGLLLQSY